jgi:protein-tyrosine phosphatase
MPPIDVNHIYEGLYQGAWPPFGDELAKRGFEVLVLAAGENQHAELYTGLEVICAPGDDDARPERLKRFLPAWMSAAEAVADRLADGKNVLVTCMAGLNRSGMITAMALHLHTGWSGIECVGHIQNQRPMALCNETFAMWLEKNLKESENPTLPNRQT